MKGAPLYCRAPECTGSRGVPRAKPNSCHLLRPKKTEDSGSGVEWGGGGGSLLRHSCLVVVSGSGLRVWAFRVWVLGFRVKDLGFGFEVWGFGFEVWELGTRVYGLESRVWGLGLNLWMLRGTAGDRSARQTSRKQGISAEPVAVSACGGCPQNLQDLTKTIASACR